MLIPYWRLSSFYFFNCLVLGAILPFWGIYLSDNRGSSDYEVSFAAAILMSTNIVAPAFWGWLSDKTQRRTQIIRVGNFLALVSFVGIIFVDSFTALIILLGISSFCWQGLNSQFEVVTLSHLSEQPQRYGNIRLWGSIGFISTVLTLGYVFDYISTAYLPFFVIAFMIFLWLSTLTVAEASRPTIVRIKTSVIYLLKQKTVWGLFLAVMLIKMSHGAYYTYYSIFLADIGYEKSVIGNLWSVAVAAEVLMFLILPRYMLKFSLRYILLFACLFTVGRWFLTPIFSGSLVGLIFLQLFHAFSFSVVHSVVVELIRQYFGYDNQGVGQALYCSICIGIGGAVGALVSGYTWAIGQNFAFYSSAFIAFLGFLGVAFFVQAKREVL